MSLLSKHHHDKHDHAAPAGRSHHSSHAVHGPARAASGAYEGTDAHDRHEGHSVEMFRDRFWITLLLTVPTLLWSELVRLLPSTAERVMDDRIEEAGQGILLPPAFAAVLMSASTILVALNAQLLRGTEL